MSIPPLDHGPDNWTTSCQQYLLADHDSEHEDEAEQEEGTGSEGTPIQVKQEIKKITSLIVKR